MSNGYTIPCQDKQKVDRGLRITIKIKRLDKLEDFIEKKVIPLKEKYPYAEIRIEVES